MGWIGRVDEGAHRRFLYGLKFCEVWIYYGSIRSSISKNDLISVLSGGSWSASS